MGKREQVSVEADDNYDDQVVGIDGGEYSSARIWERPRYKSGNFSRMFKPERPLSVEASQRHLQELLESKSDTQKGGVVLSTDEARIHMPGDTSVATVEVNDAILDGNTRIDIELKAHTHTYTIVYTGQAAYAQTSKDVLFSESGTIQQGADGVLAPTARTSHFWIEQSDSKTPLKWVAHATIPTGFVLHSSRIGERQRRSFPAPSSYRDYNNRRLETSYVSYHWKVTRSVEGALKRNERVWKSIIVVASPPDVNRNPALLAPLTYTPPPSFQRCLLTQDVKKKIFGTAGLMAVEIAMPDITTAHPIFRPVPVIIRISVRAKTPAALLELGGDLILPELPENDKPSDGKGKSRAKTEGPHFIVERETFSRAFGSNFEYSIAHQSCHVRWDSGHVGNGFIQAKGSQGYEDGREGATPRASELASQGRAHGWTWPERDTETQSWTSSQSNLPSAHQFGGNSSSAQKTLTTEDLKKYSYITTATVFGYVYLNIGPRIELPKLRVYYLLKVVLPVSGARNDMKADLTDVGVTLGVHPGERHLVTEQVLKHAVLQTETFDPEGTFLSQSQPPPPPHQNAGSSEGRRAVSRDADGHQSSWIASYLESIRADERPYNAAQRNFAMSEPVPSYDTLAGQKDLSNEKN